MNNTRSVATLATMLRRKFEGHAQIVRDIVSLMNDDELVQSYVCSLDQMRHEIHKQTQQAEAKAKDNGKFSRLAARLIESA